MKNKNIPIRMCAVCRERHPKHELIRIVKNKNGEIFVDDSFKGEGRGMYICKSDACIAKMNKTKTINRVFKTNVSDEIYKEVTKKGEK